MPLISDGLEKHKDRTARVTTAETALSPPPWEGDGEDGRGKRGWREEEGGASSMIRRLKAG